MTRVTAHVLSEICRIRMQVAEGAKLFHYRSYADYLRALIHDGARWPA